ncbi:MAG: hypothetical protein H0X27_01575 [Caulobacteraceae bacterium]|nr:hypothetical protein [Caulobacteraceae bacterium]
MLSLKAHVAILLGFLAALIAVIAAGGVMQAMGMAQLPPAWRLPALILVFVLFLGVGFAAVPVIVKTVVGFHNAVGNADLAVVKAVTARQALLIWILWGLMAAGAVVAVPAAILGGMFSPPAGQGPPDAPGASRGLLAAAPGMTLQEMARRSTLKLDIASRHGGPAPVVAGGGVFDFSVPGSAVVFRGCRYYYISTWTKDRDRIQGISIGTAPRKLTRVQLDAADDAVRARLAADGWLAGHEVYRDEEDRRLHGGAARGPEGGVWLKDGIVLNLRAKRMGEPETSADDAAGREWIQYVELWSRDDYSGIERYRFAPYRGAPGP